MAKPDYKDPYYWVSILAPPLIFSFGFLIATFYGVSMGISDGVDNSIRKIEASAFAETITKQALEGANKFVRETDILGEMTKQVSGSFGQFKDFKVFTGGKAP